MSLDLTSRSVFIDDASFPIYIDVGILNSDYFVISYCRNIDDDDYGGLSGLGLLCGTKNTSPISYGSEVVIMPSEVSSVVVLNEEYVITAGSTGFDPAGTWLFLYSRSGTSLSYESFSFWTRQFDVMDMCAMDDSVVVVVGNPDDGSGTTMYMKAVEINKNTGNFSWGAEVSETGLQALIKTAARIDKFNDTYGIVAVGGVTFAGYSYKEQLITFSLSGTSITSSLVNIGVNVIIYDVACINEDEVIAVGFASGSLKVLLFSRSGLLLTLEDSKDIYSIRGGINEAISINKFSNTEAYVFFYDPFSALKYYAKKISVSGSSLTIESTTEVDDVSSYGGFDYGYPRIKYENNLLVLAYNYYVNNYEGVIKTQAFSTSTFTPRTMII